LSDEGTNEIEANRLTVGESSFFEFPAPAPKHAVRVTGVSCPGIAHVHCSLAVFDLRITHTMILSLNARDFAQSPELRPTDKSSVDMSTKNPLFPAVEIHFDKPGSYHIQHLKVSYTQNGHHFEQTLKCDYTLNGGPAR
jgi:hypothetical protein